MQATPLVKIFGFSRLLALHTYCDLCYIYIYTYIDCVVTTTYTFLRPYMRCVWACVWAICNVCIVRPRTAGASLGADPGRPRQSKNTLVEEGV